MYGPEDHFEAERSHALGALVMKFVEAKRKNKPYVDVWGSGSPVREWLHVDDGAEAMIRAIDIKPSNDFINVGVGCGISILDMCSIIKEIVGYEGQIKLDPSKPDGAPYKTVDGRQGEMMMNWKPSIPFKKGIECTIRWYEENY